MAVHELKCWPEYYDAIADGRKRFELRMDDRRFAVGDILVLEKWKPHSPDAPPPDGPPEIFTGDYICDEHGRRVSQRVRVTYILRGGFGLGHGRCLMSIAPEEVAEALAKEGK
jgi:hypothetical protein